MGKFFSKPIIIHPDFLLLDEEAVFEYKKQGISLNVWTINDESRMTQLIEWKVGGVVSNVSDMCLKALQRD
jgi:glycerophosphoryl diester phosphodiesterase